jgi:hypothetical protein
MRTTRPRLLLSLGVMVAACVLVALLGGSGTRSAHGLRLGAFTLKSNPHSLEGESSALSIIAQPESARQSELNGAAEDYANRAYPADSIPYELTANAVSAWNQAVASSKGNTNGKNAPGTSSVRTRRPIRVSSTVRARCTTRRDASRQ